MKLINEAGDDFSNDILAILGAVQAMGNDKRQNIFKALGNFKDSGTIDLQGILRFFRFDG